MGHVFGTENLPSTKNYKKMTTQVTKIKNMTKTNKKHKNTGIVTKNQKINSSEKYQLCRQNLEKQHA